MKYKIDDVVREISDDPLEKAVVGVISSIKDELVTFKNLNQESSTFNKIITLHIDNIRKLQVEKVYEDYNFNKKKVEGGNIGEGFKYNTRRIW